MTSHFFKILTIFAVMIALGLAGVFLVNNYGQEEQATANVSECPEGGC